MSFLLNILNNNKKLNYLMETQNNILFMIDKCNCDNEFKSLLLQKNQHDFQKHSEYILNINIFNYFSKFEEYLIDKENVIKKLEYLSKRCNCSDIKDFYKQYLKTT